MSETVDTCLYWRVPHCVCTKHCPFLKRDKEIGHTCKIDGHIKSDETRDK